MSKCRIACEQKKTQARKRFFVRTPFLTVLLYSSGKILRHKSTHFFAPLPVSA